jgi:hypothetical protein
MKSKMIGDKVTRIVGKGSKDEVLPSRMAMETITKGDPMQRSMNNYAKKTPSGAGAMGPSFMMMGRFMGRGY